MRRALLLGRFQPFHFGHLAAVEVMLEEFEEVVIAIGSAYASHSRDNPLTAGERIELIRSSLPQIRDRCVIVALPDMHRNAIWVAHVSSMIPRFEAIYSNNGLVRSLFAEAGIEVRDIPLLRREEISGTRIRQRLLDDESVEDLVPAAVNEMLTTWKLAARLQETTRPDQ